MVTMMEKKHDVTPAHKDSERVWISTVKHVKGVSRGFEVLDSDLSRSVRKFFSLEYKNRFIIAMARPIL